MQFHRNSFFSLSLLLVFLFLIFYLPANVSACTIGVASGNATADGKPMLWKSRDVTNSAQEFYYFDDGRIPFTSVTYDGEENKFYGGVNAAGFAVANSNSYNLIDLLPGDDDGMIHREALATCYTVDDFQDILDVLIQDGVLLNSNYAVIDASGGASMFECATYSYTRFDADEEGGFIIRSNFSYSGDMSNYDNLVGWGLFRHDRALALWDAAVNAEGGSILDPQYVYRHVARDLAIDGTDPYPLPFDGQINGYPYGDIPNAQAICRATTRSVVVVQGVPADEDPNDAILWAMCGTPLATVPLPLWVRAGSVPVELDGDNGSLICDLGIEKAGWIYDQTGVVNTWKLTNPLENGLWDDIFPLTDMVFDEVSAFTTSQDFSYDDMEAFQNNMAALVYDELAAWQHTNPEWISYPGEVNVDEGSLIEYTVIGADSDGNSLAITFNGNGLPESAQFTDNGDGTGDFYWQTDITDAGDYTATFTLSDAIYSVDAVVPIHVTTPGLGEAYASSETTVHGTVQGSYTNTFDSDNSFEILTEIESGGNPAKNRYSYLEHIWTFEITGSALVLHAEAYHSANIEGDNFVLSGSFDGVNYTNLITVDSDNEDIYSAEIDGIATGSYYIKVTDTDHTAGKRSLDSFYIDKLSITYMSGEVPNQAPIWTDVPESITEYVDTPIEFSVTGSDPENDNLTITYTGDGVPEDCLTNTGNGTADFAWTPAELGDYMVTFTISDGVFDVDAIVTISVVELPQPGTMHVSSIELTENVINKNVGTCTGVITVIDLSDAAVEGAVVYATWSDLYNADVQGTTNANGQVTFVTANMRRPNGYVTLTITDVTKASWSYDVNNQNNVTEATLGFGAYAAGSGGLNLNYSAPVPEVVTLSPAYPNPFNDYTTIQFGLPEDSHVRVTIYDLLGKQVSILTSNSYQAGWHSVAWNPRLLANGKYIVRLESGGSIKTGYIVFIK